VPGKIPPAFPYPGLQARRFGLGNLSGAIFPTSEAQANARVTDIAPRRDRQHERGFIYFHLRGSLDRRILQQPGEVVPKVACLNRSIFCIGPARSPVML
jgi:hypothetical protein